MDFGQGQKQKTYAKRREFRLTHLKNAESCPHSLQFYSLPPNENITLQEFETYALERLKGLLTNSFSSEFTLGDAESLASSTDPPMYFCLEIKSMTNANCEDTSCTFKVSYPSNTFDNLLTS